MSMRPSATADLLGISYLVKRCCWNCRHGPVTGLNERGEPVVFCILKCQDFPASHVCPDWEEW